MKVIWSPRAKSHLAGIGHYIGEENRSAAERVINRIQNAVKLLGSFPQMGRTSRVFASARELVVSGTPHIVVYRVTAAEVQVLSIRHHGQDPTRRDFYEDS